jgi:hypothetical protein
VCSSRRPAHLLFGRHPPMQQPMDRALGWAVEIGSAERRAAA